MPCDHLPFETTLRSKVRQKVELKKPKMNYVESDEESEDELD